MQAKAGVFEFVFGAYSAERDGLLAFWARLGFTPCADGGLDAAAAGKAFGHRSALASVRLQHPGCTSFGTGFVRLQFWDELRDEGLGTATPIVTGSRWMGMYTHDILQLRDSFGSRAAVRDWDLTMSSLVNAPLAKPAPEISLEQPFVGLRETLIFGRRFRLAFIQRGGFERPGFGTFDDALPFKNTEGSHANIVQATTAFDTGFYKHAFGFETAPFGEAHDSGDEAPTIEALSLRDGELFRVERTRAPDCPTGLLQVYSSYLDGPDLRDRSRPGSGNLCAYSLRVRDLDRLARDVEDAGGTHDGIVSDEFGTDTISFTAPDGYAWLAVADDSP